MSKFVYSMIACGLLIILCFVYLYYSFKYKDKGLYGACMISLFLSLMIFAVCFYSFYIEMGYTFLSFLESPAIS